VNASRQFYVTRETADRVIAACPDAQWRLLVALSRYGGLRTPSEPLALRWSDALWDQNRMRVFVPKKEFTEDGARYVPIFPELKAPLMDAFEAADEGSEYVITRYRSTASNLRTQLTRIIKRAGLEPWPRLWHNMRA